MGQTRFFEWYRVSWDPPDQKTPRYMMSPLKRRNALFYNRQCKNAAKSCLTTGGGRRDICREGRRGRSMRTANRSAFEALRTPSVDIAGVGGQPTDRRSTRKANADWVGWVGRNLGSGGLEAARSGPLAGKRGGSMLWNLNQYRFGRLGRTSISPHGARTLLPRSGSQERTERT